MRRAADQAGRFPLRFFARRGAAPGRLEIGRLEGLLRALGGLGGRDRSGLARCHLLAQEFVNHLGAGLRALAEGRGRWAPTTQASGWRPQNWLMSETAVAAALTASIAPTDGSADFGCELPVGSSAKTMLSQNAVRNRKNMPPSRSRL
jgi:hypothetical protein